MLKPSILDGRYDGLNTKQTMKEYERDMLLYNIAENSNKSNHVNFSINKVKSVDDYYEDIDDIIDEDAEIELDGVEQLKYKYAQLKFRLDLLERKEIQTDGATTLWGIALLIPLIIFFSLTMSKDVFPKAIILSVILIGICICGQLFRTFINRQTKSKIQIIKQELKQLRKEIKKVEE